MELLQNVIVGDLYFHMQCLDGIFYRMNQYGTCILPCNVLMELLQNVSVWDLYCAMLCLYGIVIKCTSIRLVLCHAMFVWNCYKMYQYWTCIAISCLNRIVAECISLGFALPCSVLMELLQNVSVC